MFISLKLDQEYSAGAVVQYSTLAQKWQLATSADYPLGVVKNSIQDDDNQKWITRIVVAGVAHALAAESIVDQGGFLDVENGKVKISQTEKYGVIAPKTEGESERVADSLVMIHLR